MKAVIWVDTVQMGIMVAGMTAVVIQGSLRLGGIRNVFRIAAEGGRINFKEYVYSTSSVTLVITGPYVDW